MRIRIIAGLLAGLAGLMATAPAAAAGLSASGELSLVSDYRFRGLSLSNGHPAVQGGLTVEHESGFYGALWGSTIAESEGGARLEVDLVAGFATELDGGLALDVSLSRYNYPSDSGAGYVEANATVSRGFGSTTPRLGIAYAPAQRAMRDDNGDRHDNLYVFVGIEQSVAGVPLILDGQLGYEDGWFDARESGGKLDWQLGGTLAVGGFNLGLHYTDSDARFIDGRGRDLAAATVVASLNFSF